MLMYKELVASNVTVPCMQQQYPIQLHSLYIAIRIAIVYMYCKSNKSVTKSFLNENKHM